MKKILAILILSVIVFGADLFDRGNADSVKGEDTAEPVSFYNNPLNSTFNFAGKDYKLYRVERTYKGWVVQYSPYFDEDPIEAESSISFRYYIPDISEDMTPEKATDDFISENEKNGTLVLQSFQASDPTQTGQQASFVPMYVVYPEHERGNVYLTKITADESRILTIIYKQTVEGKTKEELETAATKWLMGNLDNYSEELGNIKPSDLWSREDLERKYQ